MECHSGINSRQTNLYQDNFLCPKILKIHTNIQKYFLHWFLMCYSYEYFEYLGHNRIILVHIWLSWIYSAMAFHTFDPSLLHTMHQIRIPGVYMTLVSTGHQEPSDDKPWSYSGCMFTEHIDRDNRVLTLNSIFKPQGLSIPVFSIIQGLYAHVRCSIFGLSAFCIVSDRSVQKYFSMLFLQIRVSY
jgi:hypothetical protein